MPMYYDSMGGMENMDMATSTGSGLDWLLIGVIAGSVILGIVIGILLGRKAMKKRDI